jgi:cardiolipin synthase A/B
MLEAIEYATHCALLEMYWLGDGVVVERFLQALEAAARRGVQVALLYDGLGSVGFDRESLSDLAAVAAVAEFRPLAPWRRAFRWHHVARRDHRKLLVVDGRIAFVGGINLADVWLTREEGGEGWRDTAVEVQGPIATDLCALFQRSWALARFLRRPLAVTLPHVAEPQGVPVAVLEQGFGLGQRRALRAHLARFRAAQSRIWLANAYFVPNRAVVRALLGALERGVDVRLMVAAESDVALVRHASRWVWGQLLAAGARIFEWLPSVLHAKTAVVDSEWSSIGSFNLDSLSIRNNLELNVSVLDREFSAILEASFVADQVHCHEVRREDFPYRSLSARLLEPSAYLLRRWL